MLATYSHERKTLVDIQVSDYVNVKKRALELGYEAPIGPTILPRNFDTANSSDELIHEGTVSVVRNLLQQAGVQQTKLEKEGEKIPHSIREAWEWVGPIIFIGQWVLTNTTIPVTINMISSYLYDIAKGHRHDAEVTLEFVGETVEKTKYGEKREYKRFTIKGTPEQLKALNEQIPKQLIERANKIAEEG